MKYVLLLITLASIFRCEGQKAKNDSALTFTVGQIKNYPLQTNFYDSFRLVGGRDSNGAWWIRDTMAVIKTLFRSDSIHAARFNGWADKYWALVDCFELEKYLNSGHWDDSVKVKQYDRAWKKFHKLEKKFP